MTERPNGNDLAEMARGISRDRLLRLLADYASELLEEGVPIDEVWTVMQVLCDDLGVDADELSRSKH